MLFLTEESISVADRTPHCKTIKILMTFQNVRAAISFSLSLHPLHVLFNPFSLSSPRLLEIFLFVLGFLTKSFRTKLAAPCSLLPSAALEPCDWSPRGRRSGAHDWASAERSESKPSP